MLIIDTPQAMTRAIATTINPWLRRRLLLRRDQLFDADCVVGDLGPIIVAEAGEALADIERAAGVPIATNIVDGVVFPDPDFMPSWESCEGDHGWYELTYVTSDDGSGAVIFVPDRDGIDPTIRAIVQAHSNTH